MWSKGKHEIALPCVEQQLKHFISHPWYSHSSRSYRGSEVEDCLTNVEVEGKLSVLAGLVEASAKYQHKEESSSKREVISLTSSIYSRKGYLIADRENPTHFEQKGMPFNVEGIEIGMEEILIVTSEFESDVKRTEDRVDVKVRVLFFTISAKMESLSQSASIKGCVRIDHYSSNIGQWTRLDFKADQYKEALDKVRVIEADMSKISNIVEKTPYDKLVRLRYVIRPSPQATKKIALYLELENTITTLQLRLAKLKASTTESSEKTKKVQRVLKELEGVTMENFSWNAFDNHMRMIH